MDKTARKDSSVKSVSRALKILEAFSLEQPNLSLNDLNKITGFYKSTLLRQIDTLLEEGFIVKDPKTGRYWLGAKIYLLGQIFAQSSSLLRIADPILKEVVDALQETTGIFVIDVLDRLCLKAVSGPHFIRATFGTGSRMPIYAGASGKVLMAFSPDSFLKKVIRETSLNRITPLTLTEPAKLRAELTKIRKRGWAISRGERVPSAVTISVPVLGNNEALVCSLSTSGPADRFSEKITPENIRILQLAGKKLSIEVGYDGDYWDKVIQMPIVVEMECTPS